MGQCHSVTHSHYPLTLYNRVFMSFAARCKHSRKAANSFSHAPCFTLKSAVTHLAYTLALVAHFPSTIG